MKPTFNPAVIRPLQDALNRHPIYSALSSIEDLRLFMGHHIYSVWDFMSVIKYLQQKIAPTRFPWTPIGHPSVRRFINALVLEEESDEGLPDAQGNPTYASHFELYCQAMREVGADVERPLRFLEVVKKDGIAAALGSDYPPPASRRFMETTFGFIATDKPHVVAAAFALGREHIIPGMFRSLLHDLKVTSRDAPSFHYYLNRHIHLDEDFHAPLSLLLLNELCEGDAAKLREAEEAARKAVEGRIQFWDGVLAALKANRA